LPRSGCRIFFRYWDPVIHSRFLPSGITSHGVFGPCVHALWLWRRCDKSQACRFGRDAGKEDNVRIRQISLSFTLLLLTLFFSGCRKQQLVAGEAVLKITKKQPTGCLITVANPQYPAIKDPKVSAGLFAASIEQLEITADANYQIVFLKGSPLPSTPPPIHSGNQSFPVSLSARVCATFSLTGQCQYEFAIYDPSDPTTRCDPIVHVTP
jgi:hypothetical protein